MCLANSSPTLVQKHLITWIVGPIFSISLRLHCWVQICSKRNFFPGAIHLTISWGFFELIYTCTSFPSINTQAFISNLIGKPGVELTGKASVYYRSTISAFYKLMLLVYQPASENQIWLAETEQFLPSSHSRRNKLLLSFLFELKFPCKHSHEWNVQIIERSYHRSAARK